ncbi:AzlD domain-containing protein [Rhodobacter capsulatus]|uniref:AzlD domain-containing protein n=1 Tax=Rhodobacter capsulatus TaxID=1061 RepID=UPI00402A3903
MRTELLALAALTGLATWAFRVVPTKLHAGRTAPEGPLRRFFAATGPAAIATLFTASVLPMLQDPALDPVPFFAGTAAVLGLWGLRRSVVLATLGGAAAYGLATLLPFAS